MDRTPKKPQRTARKQLKSKPKKAAAPKAARAPRPTLNEWRALAAKELKGADVSSLVWQTPEGIPVYPLYTAEDLAAIERQGHPVHSLPGLSPYLRGVRATMYAGRPWTVRQYSGFST